VELLRGNLNLLRFGQTVGSNGRWRPLSVQLTVTNSTVWRKKVAVHIKSAFAHSLNALREY